MYVRDAGRLLSRPSRTSATACKSRRRARSRRRCCKRNGTMTISARDLETRCDRDPAPELMPQSGTDQANEWIRRSALHLASGSARAGQVTPIRRPRAHCRPSDQRRLALFQIAASVLVDFVCAGLGCERSPPLRSRSSSMIVRNSLPRGSHSVTWRASPQYLASRRSK
jgi:hypothetical protein